jgi:hypothetical protein
MGNGTGYFTAALKILKRHRIISAGSNLKTMILKSKKIAISQVSSAHY